MDLINDFLNNLEEEGLISKNTIAFYKTDLKSFYNFFENKDLLNLKEEELQNYLQHIKSIYKENTQIRKITSLKSFYNYLLKKDIITTSPVEKISTSRKEVPVSEVIEDYELKAIIDAAQDNLRDKLVIKLLGETGLKIIDILNISYSQLINNDYKFFTIKDKNLYTIINISEELSNELKYYIEEIKTTPVEDKLFYGLNNQSFKVNFLKYVKKANINKNILPSMIRNKCLLERKKEDNSSHLDELSLLEKIKEEYLRIRIGDEDI